MLKITGTWPSAELGFISLLSDGGALGVGAQMSCFQSLSGELLCSVSAGLWPKDGWREGRTDGQTDGWMGLAAPSGGRPGTEPAPRSWGAALGQQQELESHSQLLNNVCMSFNSSSYSDLGLKPTVEVISVTLETLSPCSKRNKKVN